MDTSALKKFAQSARRDLVAQVSTRLDVVLAANSDERRDYPAAVTALEATIQKADREQVIEKAAYTWFNRFCALTFMDRNNYNAVHIVTPGEDGIRPAILSEALGGHVDATVPDKDRARIRALLDRTAPSREPELEAYKILLASACQQWHKRMPFMFGRIEDWTELLMPGDLLAETSVLNEMRAVMSEEACQDVEIIGWLYQFYISEKKDEVFAALKKNVKITAANIPAATQLFTPHWIVRYLVENSLGRLWLLNKPGSNLAAQMEYYIAPEEPETDFLKVSKPEEIKICDPAVGSGHMLTYAFDLLYAIYEEEGYSPDDIPALILTHNLTGIEIDDRAGALAAFALTMKAASKLGRRKFLQLKTQPNICVLQNVRFTESEMQDVAAVVGKDLFTGTLKETLSQFEQANNFGSLITPELKDPSETLRMVEAKEFAGDLLLKDVKSRVTQVLRMAEALSPKYHIVVANPPYMGSGGMNPSLSALLGNNFSKTKSDLFAAFIERCSLLVPGIGYSGFMTPFVWMYLSSYNNLRRFLFSQHTIQSLVKPSYTSFFQSAIVPICAFTIQNSKSNLDYRGHYFDLGYLGNAEDQPPRFIAGLQGKAPYSPRMRSVSDFQNIPGSPIAFQFPEEVFSLFEKGELVKTHASSLVKGIFTGDNNRFLRLWFELSDEKFTSGEWRKYNKAGGYRKWYGVATHAIDWRRNGAELRGFKGAGLSAASNFGKSHIVWGKLTSGDPSFRFDTDDTWFDDASPAIIEPENYNLCLALLNSSPARMFLKTFNPTMNLQPGDVSKVPYPVVRNKDHVSSVSQALKDISRADWDAYETSWDFTALPLLSLEHRKETFEETFKALRVHWQSMIDNMQELEEENNQIFIEAYSLQDELTPKVPLKEITLTCNPAYSIKGNKTDVEYEVNLLSRTVEEFISYAVGCMFGRYSLDAPGLILANQGETLQDYLAKVPSLTFEPDDDNVIPILDGDWFSDDITQRFRDFLRVTFGEEHFVENLEFIEEALGKDIRKYFLKDFYGDHVKRYKKRPIYWQFSSPKGYFNALIYMHRYRSDTLSIVLNDYLRDFKAKLQAHIKSLEAVTLDPSTSDREKTKAGKEIDNTRKALHDIESYESEIIFPLAEQQIDIDLDDGVKQNYPKFGKALKKVTGLSAK